MNNVMVTLEIPSSPVLRVREASSSRKALPVMVRSCPSCVVCVAVLLDTFDSDSSAVTVATLVTVVGLVTLTVALMVIVTVPPEAMVPRVPVTVPLAWLAVPCEADADTNVNWLGRMSVTRTLVAALGPVLVTVMV